jgi:murein DD-endopeptidase MepM/ murein hydrolase activator NlpD
MEEGRGGYYRPDGTSVQRQFLKAPLSFRRISSQYTLARFHPILKVRRPHQGIDYAASKGTPVWAIGDGKVTYRGWKGGFGNIVTLRHSNGIESHYAHLSRFASSLRVGQWVSQKQVVGYVGSTGLSTGPHLCFRMTRNGKYVNPASLITPVGGEPIPNQLAGRFEQKRDELFAALDPKPLAVTNEAL